MKVYKIVFANNKVSTVIAAPNKIFFGRFVIDYSHKSLLHAFVNANHENEARRKAEVILSILNESEPIL